MRGDFTSRYGDSDREGAGDDPRSVRGPLSYSLLAFLLRRCLKFFIEVVALAVVTSVALLVNVAVTGREAFAQAQGVPNQAGIVSAVPSM